MDWGGGLKRVWELELWMFLIFFLIVLPDLKIKPPEIAKMCVTHDKFVFCVYLSDPKIVVKKLLVSFGINW